MSSDDEDEYERAADVSITSSSFESEDAEMHQEKATQNSQHDAKNKDGAPIDRDAKLNDQIKIRESDSEVELDRNQRKQI